MKNSPVVFIRAGAEGYIVSQNINPGDLGFQDCLSGFTTLDEAMEFAKKRLQLARAEILADAKEQT